MQVLFSFRLGIISIPLCSNGSEDLDVARILARIEYHLRLTTYHHVLEEGEVSIRLHGFAEDVIALYIRFIGAYQPVHQRVGISPPTVKYGIGARLKVYLLQGELLYLAILIAADGVLRSHHGIRGLHVYRFGRVYGYVDDLSGNSQAIELRVLSRVTLEREGAILTQLHRVYHAEARQPVMFEVKDRVFCVGERAVYVKLFLSARSRAKHCQHHDQQRSE